MLLFTAVLFSFIKNNYDRQVVVKTKEVKSITSSGAVCEYSVTRTGSKIEHGVCVGKDPNPTYSKTSMVYKGVEDKSVSQTLQCTATIASLKSKVKYYVRAFEKLSDGNVVYGSQLSFTTL